MGRSCRSPMGLWLAGDRPNLSIYIGSLKTHLYSAFVPGETALLASSLLGKLARHDISYDSKHKLHVTTSWNAEVESLAKINAIAVNDKYLVVGGIIKDGKGAVEVWGPPNDKVPAEQLAQLSL